MKTRITDLLGCQYPVIQGGMAWVAEYHLAAAGSPAGRNRTDRCSQCSAGSSQRTDQKNKRIDG